MKSGDHPSSGRAIARLLIAAIPFSVGVCSANDVAARQQGIAAIQTSSIERREARQAARDERFRASRESLMN